MIYEGELQCKNCKSEKMVRNRETNSLCSIETGKLENLGDSGTHLNKFSKTDLSSELL